MKFFSLLIILLLNSQISRSQDFTITNFYDSAWIHIGSDSAFYLCDFAKRESLYLCECYWKSTGKLKSISMKEHINLNSKTIGLEVNYFDNNKVQNTKFYDDKGLIISSYSYYETGLLADSIFYSESGKIDSAFHYYDNGKVKALYFFDKKSKKDSLIAYNQNGEKLNNLIYLAEAHFRKSENDWINYIMRNVNTEVGMNLPPGEYPVIVRFNIEEDGKISNVKAETNYGYGLEEELISVIKKSPKWIPEIFLGETRVVLRRQPFTFTIQ